jgi:8-oxo-dGTP pyrophosphatase MutT (NUDIX family)
MLRNWKKLKTKQILYNQQLAVSEDEVELPNGKKVKYVRHSPTDVHAVLIIAVNDRHELLVQREYSYPPNKIMWQFPGGSMQSGETIKQAANRELSEESGFAARSVKSLGYFYVNNRLSDKKQHIVLCSDLYEKKLPEDHDEFIETHWLSPAKIDDLIDAGRVDNINFLAALTLYDHRKKAGVNL